jgi:Xaa-Pro aminopeptidase
MNYQARQTRLRSALGQSQLDALLVTHLANVRYLSGFSGTAGALLLTEKRSVFFSDGRYAAQAADEVQGARVVIDRKTPLTTAAEWLKAHVPAAPHRRKRSLGIEGEHLAAAAYGRLGAILGSGFHLTAAPPLVERARMIKDADEIERIRAAVLLGASLWKPALAAIRPGVRETDVAAKMEYRARKAGAEAMAFSTIIASGSRSALPHGRASEAVIPQPGFVVCDFGVILSGYCSDMTRTVYVGGQPPRGARELYQSVREAQQAALETVRPGRSVAEVDRAAHKVLGSYGLGKYFTHSTGHGVGLEIHEPPRIASGQEEKLEAGMVVTVEPGAYIPGKWGVRIEDMVVVTEAGCEVLTPTSKELVVL